MIINNALPNYNFEYIREIILILYLISNTTFFVYLQFIINVKISELDVNDSLFYFICVLSIAGLFSYIFLQYYIVKYLLSIWININYLPYIFREENNDNYDWSESYLCMFSIIPTLLTEILYISNYRLEAIISGSILIILSLIFSICLPNDKKPFITKKILCLI
jgi:hypothetical protein